MKLEIEGFMPCEYLSPEERRCVKLLEAEDLEPDQLPMWQCTLCAVRSRCSVIRIAKIATKGHEHSQDLWTDIDLEFYGGIN